MAEQCYHLNFLYVLVKKSRFIKEQEAKRLLSSLDLKKPLSKIPLLGDILFWMQLFHWIVVISIKWMK